MVTRRDRTRTQRERDQRSHTIADATQKHLAYRGLYVPMRELDQRSFNDCVDAQNWARNLRLTSALPSWLPARITWAELTDGAVARGTLDTIWADKSETICVTCDAERERA